MKKRQTMRTLVILVLTVAVLTPVVTMLGRAWDVSTATSWVRNAFFISLFCVLSIGAGAAARRLQADEHGDRRP